MGSALEESSQHITDINYPDLSQAKNTVITSRDPSAPCVPGSGGGMANFDFADFLASSNHPIIETPVPVPIHFEALPRPPYYSKFAYPTPEALQLEQASFDGDLKLVNDIMQEWESRLENDRFPKTFFGQSYRHAMRGGHISIARCLLDYGIPFKEHLCGYEFKEAMDLKSYEFLQLYLDHGLDTNKQMDQFYSTALSLTYSRFHDIEMTRWFLDHGADPNRESRGWAECNTPLGWAKPDRIQVVEYLLAKGALADINKLRDHDNPALSYERNHFFECDAAIHMAARAGHLDVVELLIARGGDPLPNSKGQIAIDVARQANHDNIVDYLTRFTARTKL
ncbi:MAG: hypothetical protein Q9178_007288 [Gyalolechia marmorata]